MISSRLEQRFGSIDFDVLEKCAEMAVLIVGFGWLAPHEQSDESSRLPLSSSCVESVRAVIAAFGACTSRERAGRQVPRSFARREAISADTLKAEGNRRQCLFLLIVAFGRLVF